MEKKMLVFDLDDTLLTSEKTITPRTVEAIKICKEKGMFIGYITGRARPMKDEVFCTEEYNLPRDFIAYSNGAEIYVGDVLIQRNVISYENAMKMIRCISEAYPTAIIGVRHEPWSYLQTSGENWNIETGEKVKCDIFELPHYEVQRIIVMFDENEADDFKSNDFMEFMTEEAIFFVTHDGSAMIVHKNARKEQALKKAAEYFNISLSDVIAFGDDVTDGDMLKTAGVGVAMANAREQVKEIADYITETNDNEGIAVWIDKYLLGRD